MKQPIDHHLSTPLSPLKRLFFSGLRTFFKLLYHQLAWTYDWVAYIVSFGTWQGWVQSVLPYLFGPRVLEIGFGTGHLQVAIYQKGISIFGLDESAQMAKIAFRRIRVRVQHPCLVRGLAQSLPFPDESFHQVVMTFPAEYIWNTQTLIEIRRVLIKGGVDIIVPFAWITGRNPLQRMVARLFYITGETPEWNEKYLEPLRNLGFEISWNMIEFNSSKVLHVRLEKSLG